MLSKMEIIMKSKMENSSMKKIIKKKWKKLIKMDNLLVMKIIDCLKK